jgi:ribonuclease R
VPALDRHALLRAIDARGGPPATARDLAVALKVPREQQATLRRLLKSLAQEGALAVVRGPRYASATRSREVSGRLQGHPSGVAFVSDPGGGPDVMIPASRRGGAVHGDTVSVVVEPGFDDDRPRGRVTAVLERRSARIVGRLRRERGWVHVEPLDARLGSPIRVALRETLDAGDGELVTVEVTRWPGPAGDAVGRVIEILGSLDDPGVDVDVVLRAHGIPDQHAPAAVAEARARDTAVHPRETAGRTDFRHDLVVTIDGEHARDFDDAVSVVRLPNGRFRLSVHIADVAHYVPEGSALDLDAFDRGTSVYFPDRAVHMFPSELATGVCSLNPHVDRLVQSCVMDVDGDGQVVGYTVHDGVIHSRARLTYTMVNGIIGTRDPVLREAHQALVPALDLMRDLFEILHARRTRRGAIDFDLPEAEVVMDADGVVADIVVSERNVAHRLIEEFMLLANETVAAHLEQHGMPALYRVHEAPDPVRVLEFETFVNTFGLSLGAAGAVHPRHFRQLVERMRNRPEERPIAYLMLRTMQKARYEAVNLGHFGLAAPTYTHFTSPIRRYPDLIVHRVLRELRHQRATPERREELDESLPEIAQHASAMERRAQEAEREVLQWKKVRFMADRIGAESPGFVTGVAPFGLFVQLTEPFVEGLVPSAALADDEYRFDGATRTLVGVRGRRVYGLGTAVSVRVTRVDVDRRQIELALVDAGAAGRGPELPTPAMRRAGPRARARPAARQRPGRRERATRRRTR